MVGLKKLYIRIISLGIIYRTLRLGSRLTRHDTGMTPADSSTRIQRSATRSTTSTT